MACLSVCAAISLARVPLASCLACALSVLYTGSCSCRGCTAPHTHCCIKTTIFQPMLLQGTLCWLLSPLSAWDLSVTPFGNSVLTITLPHLHSFPAILLAQKNFGTGAAGLKIACAPLRVLSFDSYRPFMCATQVYVEEGGPEVLLRSLSTSVHSAHMEGALRHLHHLVVSKPSSTWASSLVGDGGMEGILGAAGAVSVLLMLLQAGQKMESGDWTSCATAGFTLQMIVACNSRPVVSV
eukprot:scaffold44800_cov22-Tisochrysis_lutea.AAC.2